MFYMKMLPHFIRILQAKLLVIVVMLLVAVVEGQITLPMVKLTLPPLNHLLTTEIFKVFHYRIELQTAAG